MNLALSILAASVVPLITCLGADGVFSVSNSGRRRGNRYDDFFDVRQIDRDFATSKVLEDQLMSINSILSNYHYRYANKRSNIRGDTDVGQHRRDCSNDLFRFFKSCSYLVNPRFFSSYEHAIANKEFADCYYLIIKTVKPDCQVSKYIDILEAQCSRDQIIIQDSIFISSNDTFVTLDLKCFKNRAICPSDLVLDICQIYNMNLYDRKHLLNLLFRWHFRECDFIDSSVDNFLCKYTRIFLNGRVEDIKFTSFILYYLYSDILTNTLNRDSFRKLINMMDEYEKQSKKVYVILEFFYKVTFGKC